MNGQVTAKGFSAYQVNDALLAKVVEAIKKGEADARRYSQLRSFEVYYDGFRERLVLGRIMIVPAKLADSPEDFPSALMYGAMMKEISPEQQADLYSYKLGESEFDEYDKRGLAEIKDRLFKDADGVYRSVILFIPTWANVRDYVVFKMTRDWELLTRMVRHLVFAAYYDPKFSVAFDHFSDDTEKLNVSDITPKLNYPGLAEGALKSYPELEPGDGGVKMAGAKVRRMVLAADTVKGITQQFRDKELEPGEKAVIDSLAEELKAKIDGEIEKPAEVAKVSAAVNQTDSALARLKDIHDELSTPNSGLDVEGYRRLFIEARHLAATYPNCKLYAQQNMRDLPKPGAVKAASETILVDDSGEKSGLRSQPDYGESDSHTSEANAAAMKDASAMPRIIKKITEPKTAKQAGPEEGAHSAPCPDCKGSGKKTNGTRCWTCQGDGLDPAAAFDWRGKKGPHLKTDAKDASAKTASAYRPLIEIEGGKLVPKGKGFMAMAKGGHRETLHIEGKQVKWKNPLRFTAAFRAAAETYIRNPTHHNHKVAEVPLTFDEIWDDIAEVVGPAPTVDIQDAPSKNTESDAAKRKDTVKDDKLPETWNGDKPKVDGPPKDPEQVEAYLHEGERSDSKFAKQASAQGIGKCVACKTAVLATTGSEVAPGTFLHAACQDKAKHAAFDLYTPGQVIKEFYPELQAETVEFPGGTELGSTSDGFDPAIGLPGLSPTGVPQSADGIPGNGDAYISTDPTAAMGIGRDGKPQILEGAPLRQENDIRGYAFDQEYYTTDDNLDPMAFRASLKSLPKSANWASFVAAYRATQAAPDPRTYVAAYAVQRIDKRANVEEMKTQFATFLKMAMGEVAATFIAAFKVTFRPILTKVPGTGELQLDQVEQNNSPMPLGATNIASRVRYLMGKLTDSQIQEAINGAWASAAVWNEDDQGGYTYEVFVRPSSIDKQTMVLKYEYVVGTKGL